jgi:hypothetical protein
MILAAALLAGSAATAFAQDAGAPPAGGGRMMACRADMQKFCADKTGPDRRACMMANKDKLSDGCKSAIAARMADRAKGQ